MIFPKLPIKLPTAITKAVTKAVTTTKKIKPDIFIGCGIILSGGAVVVAIIDTYKHKDELQENIDIIKDRKHYDAEKEAKEHPDRPVMSEEQRKADLSRARKNLAKAMFKTYWKTTVIGGAGIVCIVHGKRILKRHIAELSAMYAALLESYRRYRMNVVKEYGAEKDQEFYYGLKTVDAVDLETGKVTKRTIKEKNGAGSNNARWLDEGVYDNEQSRWVWVNRLYTPKKEVLISHLLRIQNECNDMLRTRGMLTLNQVHEKLCFPWTEAGQHVGWVRGGVINGVRGDDFVDFGVFDMYAGGKYQLPINKEFLDPESSQRIPLLDFNVICIDGIWDNIFEYDNYSMVSFEERNASDPDAEEVLDRWFQNADLMDS